MPSDSSFTEYSGTVTSPVSFSLINPAGRKRSPTNLSSDDIIGELRFRGRVSGAFAQLGYLRGAYSSTDARARSQTRCGCDEWQRDAYLLPQSIQVQASSMTAGNFFTVSGLRLCLFTRRYRCDLLSQCWWIVHGAYDWQQLQPTSKAAPFLRGVALMHRTSLPVFWQSIEAGQVLGLRQRRVSC